MAKPKPKNRKSEDKVVLSSRESFPPPRYTSGRHNHAYESDDQSDIQAPPRIQSKAVRPYNRSDQTDSVKPLHKHEIDYNPSGTVKSICLCSASVYPHFHGETIIDNEIYDEILIVDPKELHTTTTNKDVRFKGQCLRLCKLAVIIIIVFAGLACGLYGVAHYFIVNKPGSALMARADVKLLQYSTYFCEKITTNGVDVDRKLTVLERKAVNYAKFNHNQTKLILLGPGQRTYQHTFYAIEQSVMQITVKTNDDVQVLIFDDKNKLLTWRNNKNYPAYKFKETCCKSVIIGRGIYSFRTKQDKQAFLVIYLPTPITTNVSLTLNFQRTFIDYRRNTETCFAQQGSSCSVPISFASDEKVVIEVPESSKAFDPRKVEWSCVARVWFYILVFVGIFIAVVIFMSLVYCIFKYCICNACCCFCCYVVPHQRESPHVVQYHKNPSMKHRAAYAQKSSTPKGPRAEHMKELKRYDSNDSIDKRAYYMSDTSDDQGLNEERRLQRKQARRMSSSNSTATSQSFVSVPLSHRRSSLGSIGSDIKKRGMDIDDSYEELPTLNEQTDGAFVININDSVDGRAVQTRNPRRIEVYHAQRGQDDDSLVLEARLQRKLAMFSDSDEEEEPHRVITKNEYRSRNRKQRARSHNADDDDYEIVGSEIATPSKSTASVIDILPLGPSGAPPEAPPKSAASIKGKPDFNKPVRMMETIEILPNGFTRDKKGEKVKKTRSDAVHRNGVTKRSPVRANVVVLNGEDKRNAEIYSTYQRSKKKEARENGMYSRTISLDSGLDKIEGESKNERRRVKPAADVKF